jgi:hypothetical protein
MSGNSITSANVAFVLTIPGVYSSGVLLENFSTDDMFNPDAQVLTESRVGADGFDVGGYVFNMTSIHIMFQANSNSIPVFYQWKSAQDASRDIIVGSGTIISPALGFNSTLPDIYLESLPLLPPHRKVAEPLTVAIRVGPGWQTTSI